jgi:Protein of unknown function (DUF1439)
MTDTRRAFLRSAALIAAAMPLSGCSVLNTAGVLLGRQISISASELQGYLDARYPRTYEPLGGLITLSVMNPEIALPEDSIRLHLDFDVGIDGLGMHNDKPLGHFAVTSGLRYDAPGNALHLEEPELESAELPLVGDRMNATGRGLINDWLRDYARNEPVYRLERSTLDQLGSHRVAGTLIRNGRIVIKLDK